MKISDRKHWEDFWHEKNNLSTVYSNSDRIIRNLEKVIDLKNKKILEVGAGTGRDSFPLAIAGAKIFQLDYSVQSLKIMQQVAKSEKIPVKILGGDTFKLPFKDETFDIVFHQGLLEHFREKEASELLKENIRVLKKGGYILVDVPQRYHIYTIVKHFLIAINKWFAGWEREFSFRELKLLLKSFDLKIIHSYGEWMYPSLFYRAFREVFRKFGILLPLYPTTIKPITNLRKKIRDYFRDKPITINSSLSFGIISKKI
ncbi:MAG: class I SAM-dependent methyltransferase [Bacteroidetes bacterium]|nr:class I SAM-dependent methyltransferase [Bacteroidota bacterium]